MQRNRPAFTRTWLQRLKANQPQPIILSGLHINKTSILHLPAEAYAQRGYEVNVAFCNPQIDALLSAGIEKLFA